MILPKASDAPHKVQMYRLLSAILNHNWLSHQLVFKGGTCAVLRGWLDRFSIDLDFDLSDINEKSKVEAAILEIIENLGFEIKDRSRDHLQFFLKYSAPPMMRNTLKLEINDQVSPHNESELANLSELNHVALTQTQSTMVANKMVAALGRLKNTGAVAGRDFYDLRYFLANGYEVKKEIVEERTRQPYKQYVESLIDFVTNSLTENALYEDINPLIPGKNVKKEVAQLREELLWLLRGLAA